MASLDNETIVFGDQVYDILYGTGVVVQILPDNKFRVNYTSNGKTLTYDNGGFQFRLGARTLYWRNPVLTIPTKNEAKWALISALCQNVVSTVRAWSN